MQIKKISKILLIALVAFPQLSETIYTPALPSVAQGLLSTASAVEATLSIYFVGFALGVLIWGSVSDIIGRRLSMLIGLVIYGGASYLCGNVQTINQLLGWRFVQAFGASVGSVVTQTILRDVFDGIERVRFFSILSGALAISPAVGPVLGGLISEFFGWRANFYLLVLIALYLFFWCYFKLEETRPLLLQPMCIKDTKKIVTAMLSSSLLYGHILLIGATNSMIFGFYQEAPFIFIETMRIRPSLYGLVGLLIASSTIIAAAFSYYKNKTLDSHHLIRWGVQINLFASIFLCIFVFNQQFLPGFLQNMVLLALIGSVFFGIGLIIPNSLSYALKPYKKNLGTAGSIFGGCYYLFISLSTGLLSVSHNGKIWLLPVYLTILSLCLKLGYSLIEKKSRQAILDLT